MDYVQASAIATLTLPQTHAKVIATGEHFILWWTDCGPNEWTETHYDLGTALTRLAVLHHCITNDEGFAHPNPADFTDIATAFLASAINGPPTSEPNASLLLHSPTSPKNCAWPRGTRSV